MVRSDVKEDGPFRFLLREDSDLNCPFGCKGDGVGHHVSEDLAKPRAVPQEKLRNGRIYVKFQGKPPFPDRKGERPDRSGTGCPDGKEIALKREPSRFNEGKVEQFLNEAVQIPRRCGEHFDEFFLLQVQPGPLKEVCHADDGVERGKYFVAEVGDEGALVPAALLGPAEGILEFRHPPGMLFL